MAEQQIRQISSTKGEMEARSLLLMPIMEGHTLENGDISGFLGGRLAYSSDDDTVTDDEPELS
jgi:hypothetical protein